MTETKRILVTGGAGFIGSAVVRRLIGGTPHEVCVYDKLTYAGNLASLAPVAQDPRYHFIQADICDAAAVRGALQRFRPDIVMHLAAESHVDRSIEGPGAFIQTNIVGTYVLLHAAHEYWKGLKGAASENFRFHHISTDEVFGSLGEEGFFREETPYAPNSPYSASKAGSDHLVRAWRHTYGLPTVATNCSNNYGPYHFPEKLIPLMILNALDYKPLPVYGRGENIRDWLFVDDHVDALLCVIEKGRVGESYNVGVNERRNIDVVHTVCDLVDEMAPRAAGRSRRDLIAYVQDRPGHDLRYAIDCSKLQNELGWKPRETFESGLRKTVRWYLDNRPWWEAIRAGPIRVNDWAWPSKARAKIQSGRFKAVSQGMIMIVEDTALAGVKIVTPRKHGDHRGFFSEIYNRSAFEQAGLALEFVQDNHSRSAETGTVRGLHFQSPPFAQDKLVRVTRGAILDVAVDLRASSPTFGRHVAVELSAENWRQLLVPIGFAHGFCTLEPDTEVLYKVTNYYSAENDKGLAWDDPALGIVWPATADKAVLSGKDRQHPRLKDLPPIFD